VINLNIQLWGRIITFSRLASHALYTRHGHLGNTSMACIKGDMQSLWIAEEGGFMVHYAA